MTTKHETDKDFFKGNGILFSFINAHKKHRHNASALLYKINNLVKYEISSQHPATAWLNDSDRYMPSPSVSHQ